MYQVTADSLGAYLNFDAERKSDLVRLHAVIRTAAPNLKRYFHKGTPAGEAGMRMKMIGYGKFRYAIKSGSMIEWAVVGVALQKNYVSVYVAVTKAGAPIVKDYVGRLGELRSGNNNFSFARFDDLNLAALSSLFAEAGAVFAADPENPVRYMQGA
jgi:hypothetical protein